MNHRAGPLSGPAPPTRNPMLSGTDTLFEDVACLRRGNKRLGVVRKQEALGHRLAGRGFDGRHVTGVVGVALFKRRTRVEIDSPLRLGLGERDHTALVIADLSLAE